MGRDLPQLPDAWVMGEDGARDGTYIEPTLLPSILEKLEEWDYELQHSPEAILRLRELNSANAADDGLPKNKIDKPIAPSRPKRSGPSL
jgi:hypothetical protein